MNVIEKLRELDAKATSGPWRECGHDRGGCRCGIIWSLPEDRPVMNRSKGDEGIEDNDNLADELFTSTTRNLFPLIIDVLEALSEELDPEYGLHSIQPVVDAYSAFEAAAAKELGA